VIEYDGYLKRQYEEISKFKQNLNYTEAILHKGPCDGLGGLTKRLADEAVNMGKVTIQNANKFYAWSQSSDCPMKSVDFIFISSGECQRKIEDVGHTAIKPIHSTLKMHAVVNGKEPGVVYVGDVSCFCSNCRTGDLCAHRKIKRMIKSVEKSNEKVATAEPEPEQMMQHQIEKPIQDERTITQESSGSTHADDSHQPNAK